MKEERILTISQINIYPVKACRGISVQKADLTPQGLRYDRRWMVVDEENRFLSQRTHPKMALIQTELLPGKVLLRASGQPPLIIKMDKEGEKRTVVVRKDSVEAIDMGDEAAEWLSDVMKRKARLVYIPDETFRPIDPKYATSPQDQVGFADAYPLLLTSEASLGDLNLRLPQPIQMNRFRPNLVISGCEPYEEDSWKKIRVGDVILECVKPCSRCVVTCVDQATGEKGEEPLKTLTCYRKQESGIIFGQNLIHKTLGTLSVGQELLILK